MSKPRPGKRQTEKVVNLESAMLLLPKGERVTCVMYDHDDVTVTKLDGSILTVNRDQLRFAPPPRTKAPSIEIVGTVSSKPRVEARRLKFVLSREGLNHNVSCISSMSYVAGFEILQGSRVALSGEHDGVVFWFDSARKIGRAN